MTDRSDVTGDRGGPAGDPGGASHGLNPTRALLGGAGILLSLVGFAATEALIESTALADDLVLVALPAFGILGIVGLVAFVSAMLPAE